MFIFFYYITVALTVENTLFGLNTALRNCFAWEPVEPHKKNTAYSKFALYFVDNKNKFSGKADQIWPKSDNSQRYWGLGSL